MLTADDKAAVEKNKVLINRNKERIKRLRVLTDGADSDFWKAIKGELQVGIEANEYGRDRILGAEGLVDSLEKDMVALKANAFAIRAYKSIIDSVEKAQEQIEECNKRIEEFNRRIARITDKQGVSNAR